VLVFRKVPPKVFVRASFCFELIV